MLTVVLCGSFRRNPEELRREHDLLVESGCLVLSPDNLDWVEEREGFVLAADELGKDPGQIEASHLAAMRQADFVWLHAADGYVGRSAAMELGYAYALGLRVFAEADPDDLGLRGLVETVGSPSQAVEEFRLTTAEAPSRSLGVLQDYYRRVAVTRGYDSEDDRDCLLLLTEEVGELARAIRKRRGLMREAGWGAESVSSEIADVQLYLVHLANIVGVDLSEAIVAKERVNDDRFRRRQRSEAA